MNNKVHGAGLGLRRDFLTSLEQQAPQQINFIELVPENWIGVGGHLGKKLRYFTERYPVVAHGLSLNIGGPAPLDEPFLQRIKQFLDTHQVLHYTDHLTYCADDGHLYDLMPIPFTEEAVHYVADRIRRTQDILERKIAMENASYYAAPGQEMTEIDFVNAVISEADCDFLIDINNIYVNSVNHNYDPEIFLKALPSERIVYAHIAGHYNEEDFIIDTHGKPVIDRVWELLDIAYQSFGVFPTLLERDFNIPPLDELLQEVDMIVDIQARYAETVKQVQHG
ncbi:DUF692 domain-containing protein [Candidatus Albibeggiatoa sp. nov. NOAA]|uniref:HvfB family MNIO-type RiPP peptide maturase n=1 Tax=Candidatus Albibeggiatoa sp. nov. NOAA TaxID=3162724 RepID=UPI0032FB1893|nr:DUF692 domain-containing protein [Thiotrichaceae bacterium]